MDFRIYEEVAVPVGKASVKGEIIVPFDAKAVIIFSHGSGSSRKSIRNQQVANYLHQKKFGTFLFDLLTEEEDRHYHNRFDIDLLTQRLTGVTKWLEKQKELKGLEWGYFGASTGAASALKAAVSMPRVGAVVSRGGRPDLALNVLHKVKAPVLLIVGSLDFDVLRLNQEAYEELTCEKKLAIVEGATHLFEEQGAMAEVSEWAARWFTKYLNPVRV